MAVSLGKNFRRLLAQALAADEDEMRALVERVLPRGEDGKRMLRIENEDDRRLVRLAIVAALSVDAISGDEAEELKRQVLAESGEARRSFWDATPRDLVALSPLERRRLGYVPPPGMTFPPWRQPGERRCDAAESGAAIVNNNENTMAVAGDHTAGQKPNPL